MDLCNIVLILFIQEKNMSFYCYEDNEYDNNLLINFDYWVSGVAILTVGIGNFTDSFVD